MPRGGWRPGAGKPKGAKNRRTREAAERIAAAAGRAIAASSDLAASVVSATTATATAATTAPEAELPLTALPLDVMVAAMRAHLAVAKKADGGIDLREIDKAAAIAKDAAPYIHPRLVSSSNSNDKETVIVIRGGLSEPPRSEHGN